MFIIPIRLVYKLFAPFCIRRLIIYDDDGLLLFTMAVDAYLFYGAGCTGIFDSSAWLLAKKVFQRLFIIIFNIWNDTSFTIKYK